MLYSTGNHLRGVDFIVSELIPTQIWSCECAKLAHNTQQCLCVLQMPKTLFVMCLQTHPKKNLPTFEYIDSYLFSIFCYIWYIKLFNFSKLDNDEILFNKIERTRTTSYPNRKGDRKCIVKSKNLIFNTYDVACKMGTIIIWKGNYLKT